MTDWNPEQYLKFERERTQPAYDLLNRIPLADPKNIIDIGCGPGNSTNVIQSFFPNAKIIGIDNSKNMIETAKKEYPQLDFKLCDVTTDLHTINEKYDIVFSNACIQWVPEHEKIIPRLFSLVKEGGVLAVQTPMNFHEPIHNIIQEVSWKEQWKGYFSYRRKIHNLMEEEYFDLLSTCTDSFEMWKTTYFYRMQDYKGLLEYCRTTGLRPFLDQLPDDQKQKFIQEIYELLPSEYGIQKNGEVISKCPRFFFIAKNTVKAKKEGSI